MVHEREDAVGNNAIAVDRDVAGDVAADNAGVGDADRADRIAGNAVPQRSRDVAAGEVVDGQPAGRVFDAVVQVADDQAVVVDDQAVGRAAFVPHASVAALDGRAGTRVGDRAVVDRGGAAEPAIQDIDARSHGAVTAGAGVLEQAEVGHAGVGADDANAIVLAGQQRCAVGHGQAAARRVEDHAGVVGAAARTAEDEAGSRAADRQLAGGGDRTGEGHPGALDVDRTRTRDVLAGRPGGRIRVGQNAVVDDARAGDRTGRAAQFARGDRGHPGPVVGSAEQQCARAVPRERARAGDVLGDRAGAACIDQDAVVGDRAARDGVERAAQRRAAVDPRHAAPDVGGVAQNGRAGTVERNVLVGASNAGGFVDPAGQRNRPAADVAQDGGIGRLLAVDNFQRDVVGVGSGDPEFGGRVDHVQRPGPEGGRAVGENRGTIHVDACRQAGTIKDQRACRRAGTGVDGCDARAVAGQNPGAGVELVQDRGADNRPAAEVIGAGRAIGRRTVARAAQLQGVGPAAQVRRAEHGRAKGSGVLQDDARSAVGRRQPRRPAAAVDRQDVVGTGCGDASGCRAGMQVDGHGAADADNTQARRAVGRAEIVEDHAAGADIERTSERRVGAALEKPAGGVGQRPAAGQGQGAKARVGDLARIEDRDQAGCIDPVLAGVQAAHVPADNAGRGIGEREGSGRKDTRSRTADRAGVCHRSADQRYGRAVATEGVDAAAIDRARADQSCIDDRGRGGARDSIAAAGHDLAAGVVGDRHRTTAAGGDHGAVRAAQDAATVVECQAGRATGGDRHRAADLGPRGVGDREQSAVVRRTLQRAAGNTAGSAADRASVVGDGDAGILRKHAEARGRIAAARHGTRVGHIGSRKPELEGPGRSGRNRSAVRRRDRAVGEHASARGCYRSGVVEEVRGASVEVNAVEGVQRRARQNADRSRRPVAVELNANTRACGHSQGTVERDAGAGNH